MFTTRYVCRGRRDLLKQLAALGALSLSGVAELSRAQTAPVAGSAAALVHRDRPGYDALRSASLWRGNLPNRYPDVIVEAASVADLRQALEFARQNDLQVVCRASGHSTAGAPLRNGGMMIYVRSLSRVAVDAEARTARIEPGVTMAGLFGQASLHGLDFPTADCSTVALTGFILGGGFGRNCMHLTGGPVCNALLSAQVMLANGEIVTVNEQSHPELYWAMRGCGPAFFGIVTEMTLRLFDPPGAYLASTYQYSLDALPALVEFFDRHQGNQDARVSNRISVRPNPESPAELIVVARVTAFADLGPAASEQARELIAYYANAGLAQSAFERQEYEVQNLSTYMATSNPDAGTHTDNVFTDDASALLAAAPLMDSRPDGFAIHLDLGHNMQFHAASGGDIAYSAEGRHFLTTYIDWNDPTPERNARAYEWADRFAALAEQFGKGNYLNQVDTGRYPQRIRQSFAPQSRERLERIRAQYDPGRRFFSYVERDA